MLYSSILQKFFTDEKCTHTQDPLSKESLFSSHPLHLALPQCFRRGIHSFSKNKNQSISRIDSTATTSTRPESTKEDAISPEAPCNIQLNTLLQQKRDRDVEERFSSLTEFNSIRKPKGFYKELIATVPECSVLSKPPPECKPIWSLRKYDLVNPTKSLDEALREIKAKWIKEHVNSYDEEKTLNLLSQFDYSIDRVIDSIKQHSSKNSNEFGAILSNLQKEKPKRERKRNHKYDDYL